MSTPLKTYAFGKSAGLFGHSFMEYWMVLKALLVVMTIKVLLRFFSFEKVVKLTDRKPSAPKMKKAAPIDRYTSQIVRAVRAVARRFLGDKPCLPQALAVKYLLARAGKASDLRIGVIKNAENNLDAHAWLEVDGDVIIGGRRMSQSFVKLNPIK